jgi:alpha-tubulin suppressor-like RCC1 family protein
MKKFKTLVISTIMLFAVRRIAQASSPGEVVFWGYGINTTSLNDVLPGVLSMAGQPLTNIVAIAAGMGHGLALRVDGTVVGWGNNGRGQATGTASPYDRPIGIVSIDGQILSNVTTIAAGGIYSEAIRSDGTVAVWGTMADGNKVHVASSITNAISLAGWYPAASTSDGHVVDILSGAAFNSFSNITAISYPRTAFGGLVSLTRDGVVLEGGLTHTDPLIPVGVSNAVAISAGVSQHLALKSDGTVFEWGNGSSVPSGLSNVVAISSGDFHSLALKSDGTVVTWGANPRHSLDVPHGLSNVVAIAAGNGFSLTITTNKSVADKFRH